MKNKISPHVEFKTKNVITDDAYKLPIDEFLGVLYNSCDSLYYGNIFAKRVMHDSHNQLQFVTASENIGDCFFIDKKTNTPKYVEIKIAYLKKDGINFNVHNIRPYQNFDYYLTCFVDTINRTYDIYFFKKNHLVNCNYLSYTPTIGTKESNANNENVPLTATIKAVDVNFIFSETNLLKGTSYSDLINFFKQVKNDPQPEIVTNVITSVKANQPISKAPAIRFKFIVDDGTTQKIIANRSNILTNVDLINYLGPEILSPYFDNSSLSTEYGKFRTIKLNDHYYFNPKIGIREMKKYITNFNNYNSNKIKIKLINAKTNETII